MMESECYVNMPIGKKINSDEGLMLEAQVLETAVSQTNVHSCCRLGRAGTEGSLQKQ